MTDQNGQTPAAVKEKPWQVLEDEDRRAKSTGPGIAVTTGGKVYRFHFGEMSALDVAALRRYSGYSGLQLLNLLLAAPDVDLVAAVVWMCRRMAGEAALTLDEVATGINWGTESRVEWLPVDKQPTPEAPPEVVDEVTGEPDSPPA